MGFNFNDTWKNVKSGAQGVEDKFKENPLEKAYNSIRDRINGIGGRSIPSPGNTIGDFFINRDGSLNEGYDDWERLIDFNITNKEVLDPILGDVPNSQLVYLANTAMKFNVNSELSSLVEGALTSDPPRAFGRITDLTRRKFVYGMNDYVNYIADSLFEDVVDKIEDPTILSFTLELDTLNSPLFDDADESMLNFILDRAFEIENSATTTSTEGKDTSTIPSDNVYFGVSQAWSQFKQEALKFFQSFDTHADTAENKAKTYYVTEIGNINKLDKPWTGSEDGETFELDYLTVKMREDVKMSARNLAMLYNSMKYHQYSGKELIPENLLRFNMWIKISEVRNFTSLRQYVKGNNSAKEVIRAIRKDISSLYYYVEDCEFDFNTLHTDDSGQKYSTENPTEFESLTFKIKFRRAQRMFKPTLLYSTTSSSDPLVFHIDERMNDPFIREKYYTQENTDSADTKNTNLPFNSLMTGRPETLFSNYAKTSKKRTIVPDGLVRGSALFRDKYNQSTKDEIGSRTSQDSGGGFLNTLANTALDVGEAYLETEIGTSIRGLKDTFAQKIIRSTNSTLTRLRNDLVRDLNNKIINEEVGTPSPRNVYAPSNSKSAASSESDNAIAQQLSPSLQGRPINIGTLQAGFYNLYPINPNDTTVIENDDRAVTTNYIDGKVVSKDKHSTYQIISDSNLPGSDTIISRDLPVGDLHPDSINIMNTDSLDDKHPDSINVMDTDSLDDKHPDGVNVMDTDSLGDLHPDGVNVMDTDSLDDKHPDGVNIMDTDSLDDKHPDIEPREFVKDLGDRHPDGENIMDTDSLDDRHPDGENIMDTDSLDDRHPDGEPREFVKDLGDKHPDGEPREFVKDLGDVAPDGEPREFVKDLGDIHPDGESENILEENNLHQLTTDQSSDVPDGDLHPDVNTTLDTSKLDNVNPDNNDDNDDAELGNVNK